MENECNCKECKNRRALAENIKQLKKELPKPEYDWEDLECQDRKRRLRENIDRVWVEIMKDAQDDGYKAVGESIAEALISGIRGEHVQEEDKEEGESDN